MIGALTKPLTEILKLAPRYLTVIALMTGVLLFGGQELLEHVGVRELAQNNRAVVGLVFLLASAGLLASATIEAGVLVRRRLRNRYYYRRMKQRLNALTEAEKQVLRFYIGKQTRTQALRIDDGVVCGLEAAGIIHQVAEVGSLIEGFAYNIDEFAWNYLYVDARVLAPDDERLEFDP